MADDIDVKRVCWPSRRGMLELDVLLVPFAEQAYASLAEEDKARYRDMLEREDPDLFSWFMEYITPDEPDMERIVNLVREHARSR